MRIFGNLLDGISSSQAFRCLTYLLSCSSAEHESIESTWCRGGLSLPNAIHSVLDEASSVWFSKRSIPDLLDLSIDDVIAGFTHGTFTSHELTGAYMRRIQEVNPTLHAVIEMNPDALEIARSMDALTASGISLGPLHGVPILVKDNIATKDCMNTTAGSFALQYSIVPADATVIQKLRDAGAVILGKTNLSEFANWRSSNSSNGWSGIGGQTYGAYFHEQDPSGSSSGSAVAMSVGLSTVSLGSETDGSIVSPANVNGVVGLKPTVGLVSRAGVIPISSHQDTVGPITKTVRDAARVLQIIAGQDDKDNDTLSVSIPDYLAACTSLTLPSTTKIGIPRQLFSTQAPPYLLDLFADAVSTIRQLGADVVDVDIPSFSNFDDSIETLVLQVDFKHDLESYLSTLTNTPIHTLQQLIDWTELLGRQEECFPSRDTARFRASQNQSVTYGSSEHWDAIQHGRRTGGTLGIDAALKNINGSALLLPTAYASTIAAISGYPIISIPMGYMPDSVPVKHNDRNSTVIQAPGIPVGISLITHKFHEVDLLRIAYAFEQATQSRTRHRPIIKPSTQIRHVQNLWRRLEL